MSHFTVGETSQRLKSTITRVVVDNEENRVHLDTTTALGEDRRRALDKSANRDDQRRRKNPPPVGTQEIFCWP